MSPHKIFFLPGELLTKLTLSILQTDPSQIEPELVFMMSLLYSIFVWAKVIQAVTAIVKKAFGFENKSPF